MATVMPSAITFDGRTHLITSATLRFDGSDWTLVLTTPEGTTLELYGEADGDRLRLDLRALDELLGHLQGAPITSYPRGQEVCAAFFDVRASEGEGMLLTADFELDWDRALDPPGARYPEPRRVGMRIATG